MRIYRIKFKCSVTGKKVTTTYPFHTITAAKKFAESVKLQEPVIEFSNTGPWYKYIHGKG